MPLSLAVLAAHHELRTKELVIAGTPTGLYPSTTKSLAAGAFTQSAAGAPLRFTLLVGFPLTGSVTFATAGGAGAGTQAVNMATYSNLSSATPSLVTAAAAALGTALTAGALGVASGATYTVTVAAGVVSIATTVGAETLSASVSTLVQTNPAGGGDIVDLTHLSNPNNSGDAMVGYPGKITDFAVLQCPLGYKAELIQGATLSTWRLQIEQTGSGSGQPFSELPYANYPAALLAGTFVFRIRGPKGRI